MVSRHQACTVSHKHDAICVRRERQQPGVAKHWRRFSAETMLGASLAGLKKYGEAELLRSSTT
jgi:hypothetical protein